jgi:carbon starvation protein
MGVYMRVIRPGRVGEASVFGVVLLLASIFVGRLVAESPTWAPPFTLTGAQLAWALILYGAVAASLPVWLMLAPRDYLSTFLKIGTIVALALGIYVVAPTLAMPATTRFLDGSGPVFSGQLFPFLFITIACGSVSGFPLADLVGHDTQDDREGVARASSSASAACWPNRSSR